MSSSQNSLNILTSAAQQAEPQPTEMPHIQQLCVNMPSFHSVPVVMCPPLGAVVNPQAVYVLPAAPTPGKAGSQPKQPLSPSEPSVSSRKKAKHSKASQNCYPPLNTSTWSFKSSDQKLKSKSASKEKPKKRLFTD
ncbi:hypothetical protein Moror_12384 [Moniliophthora roreri MCA 2997]|uniref:Uncharacterized protein n=2 Tax=Moniliophthora roreri TaxID=221103 RepID=V2XPX4_MONRO|nr:hypothetical protein Moror_12384 [Moniliophthora roreri MCA 2997]